MSSLPLCSGFWVGDHDLRRRVAICDEIAFETLLRRHSDEPLRVARAMLKDGAADTDEVLQEVTSLPIANLPTSVPLSSYRVGWPARSATKPAILFIARSTPAWISQLPRARSCGDSTCFLIGANRCPPKGTFAPIICGRSAPVAHRLDQRLSFV